MNGRNTLRGGKSGLAVVPNGDGWAVKQGAEAATSIHATQSGAIAAAARELRATGGWIEVRGRNGQVRKAVSVGLEGATKIAAVEQIDLATALQGFFPQGDTASTKEHLARLADELRGRKS